MEATLHARLQTEGYSSLDDNAAALKLNTDTVTIQQRLTDRDLMRWGAATGARGALQDIAEAVTLTAITFDSVVTTTSAHVHSAARRSLALTALDLMKPGSSGFDTGDAQSIALLASIVGVGEFTQGMHDALVAMGAVDTSEAAYYSLPDISGQQVANVRALGA